MKPPKDLVEKYYAFFVNEPAGQYLVERLQDLVDTNTRKARDHSSLSYLDRSAGNQEALDLIEVVLKKGARVEK